MKTEIEITRENMREYADVIVDLLLSGKEILGKGPFEGLQQDTALGKLINIYKREFCFYMKLSGDKGEFNRFEKLIVTVDKPEPNPEPITADNLKEHWNELRSLLGKDVEFCIDGNWIKSELFSIEFTQTPFLTHDDTGKDFRFKMIRLPQKSETERWILPLWDVIRLAIENGYTYNEYGQFVPPTNNKLVLPPHMLQHCGEKDDGTYIWPDWAIEEREVTK